MESYLPETIYKDDIFLVSYPKSGNTWLRFLLGNYLSRNQCDFANAHLIIPDIHYNPQHCSKIPRPRIIKSHSPYTPDYKKVIYLVRDGLDVAVSYYFHSMKYGHITKDTPFEKFMDLFNEGKLDSFGLWGDHITHWLDHEDENLLVVRYEDLKKNTYHELERVVGFCGLPVGDDRLNLAIEASSFDRMKKLEREQADKLDLLANSDRSVPFIRKGISGEAKKYFTGQLLHNFVAVHGPALRRLNYIPSTYLTIEDSIEDDSRKILDEDLNGSLEENRGQNPTIFHITHWKAGSQWVYKILKDCVPDLIVAPEGNEELFLHEKLQSGKVYPTVYITKEVFDNADLPEDWRRFIVFRDLRDTLISGYFSMKISHPVIDKSVMYRRQKLSELNHEDGLIFLLDEFLNSSALIQKSWLDAGTPFLRYEDLIDKDLEILIPVLLDDCQLPVSQERLEEVIINSRFSKLTGGRAPGQEDITAHTRKGIAGDWKNYFTPRLERIFNARFGDLLIKAGYEVKEDYGSITPGFSEKDAAEKTLRFSYQYEGLLERAAVQLNAQNNDLALKLLDEAVDEKPENSSHLYGKAVVLTRLGDFEQANLYLNRVLAEFPRHRKARYLQDNLQNRMAQIKLTHLSEDTNQSLTSPVTGSTNIRFESEVDCRTIIEKYQRVFCIDVSPYFSNNHKIKIYECLDTGYRFYYPFNVLGDSKFYEQLQKFSWYYMDWKWEYQIADAIVTPNSSILEIGCGQGAFLEYLRKKGVFGIGLELNETALTVMNNKGIMAVNESIQTYSVNHKEEFDYVCCFQVLEHISEVKQFLDSAIHALKPNGKLILSVPNNDAFMFKQDEDQLLNRPPHHMGLWTTRSLIALCRFFPLRLEGIEFEPVQAYHGDFHTELVKKHLTKTKNKNGKHTTIGKENTIEKIVKLFTTAIPGHTILVHYTKV